MKDLKNRRQHLNIAINVVIGVLVFLMFCVILSLLVPKDFTKYQNEIKDLNAQISSLNEKIENNEKQISDLTTSNKSIADENQKLKEEKSTLESEKNNLINEKNELNTKIDQLQKTTASQSQTSTSSTSSTTSSHSSTSDSKPVSPSTSSNTNSEMVWVGETGTKYHIQSCRTLKGKGHQITLQQALSEGKQACKVCH